MSLTVTAVNDAPVAGNVSATTKEDTPLIGALVAIDVDSAVVTFRVVTGPAHGTLVLSAAGVFTYTPSLNYFGTDSFTFVANDGIVDSSVRTASLTITAVNDAPVAANVSATTKEDTPVVGALVAIDVDSAVLTFRIVVGPLRGTLVLERRRVHVLAGAELLRDGQFHVRGQ